MLSEMWVEKQDMMRTKGILKKGDSNYLSNMYMQDFLICKFIKKYKSCFFWLLKKNSEGFCKQIKWL